MILTPIDKFTLQFRILLTSWLTVLVAFVAAAVVTSPLGQEMPRLMVLLGIAVTSIASLLFSRWLCPEVKVERAANERDSE